MEIFSNAYAQEVAATAAGEPSVFASLIPIFIIFFIFYFIVIRPQQRKYKEHQQMLTELVRGDKIVTAGGIVGKIARVGEKLLEVEIAKDVIVEVSKSMVSEVTEKKSKSSPAPSNDNTKTKAKKKK